jgi:hypothetical protein
MATERLAGYEQLVGQWDAAQHRAALADGRHAYFVARHASEAIGFAIVREWSSAERVAHIKRIAVCRPGLGNGRFSWRSWLSAFSPTLKLFGFGLACFPTMFERAAATKQSASRLKASPAAMPFSVVRIATNW